MTTENQPVFYSIEAPGVEYYEYGIITADHEVILDLPYSVIVSSLYDNNKGIYIKTSSTRVTVYGQAFVQGYTDHDSYYWPRDYAEHLEAFVAVPVIDLCSTEYKYYAVSVNGYSSYYNSSVLVVGVEDNTTMKLTVTKLVIVYINYTITHLIPGEEYLFVINRLQTVYVGSSDDLTGSKIVTDKQVSVFSGHQYGNITDASPSASSVSSYLIEQIPPTVLWGKVYYLTPLTQQKSDYYFIKIVASQFCVIKIYRNSSSLTFSSGLYEGESVYKNFSNNESYTILSTAEILVMQFSSASNGLMMTIPSIKQYYNNFVLSIIQSNNNNTSFYEYTWYHYVNIIVTAQSFQPNMIYLIADGYNRSLDTQKWAPIIVNNITEAYTSQMNITHGVTRIFHIDETAMMTVMVYGLSSYGSYGTAISNNINKGIIVM